jgi:cobalt/nickel transport system ATP-binding protein
VSPSRHFSKIRERVGVLLQNVEEQIIAPTVWDDVSYSPRSYGHAEADVEARVGSALRQVGIEHLRHKVCHHLSGGERRKVALAGALVLDPELLVLDEPFEGLDPASRSDLRELLNRLHRERGVTLVMATHDVNVVPLMADQVFVLLRGGEIVARGTPGDVFRDPGLLRRSNIEPPVLSELFQLLAEEGYDLGHPISVEDAAEAIARRVDGIRAAAGPEGGRERAGDGPPPAPRSTEPVATPRTPAGTGT